MNPQEQIIEASPLGAQIVDAAMNGDTTQLEPGVQRGVSKSSLAGLLGALFIFGPDFVNAYTQIPDALSNPAVWSMLEGISRLVGAVICGSGGMSFANANTAKDAINAINRIKSLGIGNQ